MPGSGSSVLELPCSIQPPCLHWRKRPNTLKSPGKKCGSLLLGHGSKNRTSFQGRSARLKLTEQNGKCVREGKAENGPSRSSGRSHSPLQPAMPRNKAAPGLPRGSLAGRLWDSPAKSSQPARGGARSGRGREHGPGRG